MLHKKRGIFLASLISLAVIFVFSAAAFADDVPRITKEELKGLLGNPDVVVLDVRTNSDWKSSDYKIKGAVRESKSKVSEWAEKYSKDKKLVLYCA